MDKPRIRIELKGADDIWAEVSDYSHYIFTTTRFEGDSLTYFGNPVQQEWRVFVGDHLYAASGYERLALMPLHDALMLGREDSNQDTERS